MFLKKSHYIRCYAVFCEGAQYFVPHNEDTNHGTDWTGPEWRSYRFGFNITVAKFFSQSYLCRKMKIYL